MRAVRECGEDNVRLLSGLVGTRTIPQIRTHLQKYNLKVSSAVSRGYLGADMAGNLLCRAATPLLQLFADSAPTVPHDAAAILTAERARELVSTRPGLVGVCTLISLCSSLANAELKEASGCKATDPLENLLARPKLSAVWKGGGNPLSTVMARALEDLRARESDAPVGAAGAPLGVGTIPQGSTSASGLSGSSNGSPYSTEGYAFLASLLGVPVDDKGPKAMNDQDMQASSARRQAKKRWRAQTTRQALSYMDVAEFLPLASASWDIQDVLEADSFLGRQLGSAWPQEYIRDCLSRASANNPGACITMIPHGHLDESCPPSERAARPPREASSGADSTTPVFLDPGPISLAAESLILSLLGEGKGRIALLAQAAALAAEVSRATGDPPWVVIHHVASELGDEREIVAGLSLALSALAAQTSGFIMVFGKA